MARRLTKSTDKVLDGVVAGLSEYFGIDITLGRILFVVFFFVTGFFPMGIIYIILMFIMDDPGEARY